MINAKILNNFPICGNCGSSNLSGIRDYNPIEIDNEQYVVFEFQCYNCRAYGEYIADIGMDKTTRYEAKGNIKEINE